MINVKFEVLIAIMGFSNKAITISIFLIGSLAIIVLFLQLEENSKNIVNFFTLYGTYASLFGIFVAYIQIIGLKEVNEETKKAVKLASERIDQVLSVSDLSKSIKIVQEVQGYLQHEKIESALIRMRDLKVILIQIKFNNTLSEFTIGDSYKQHIITLGLDIINLNNFILGVKKEINFPKVNQNLESLATILIEFENKLKFQRHDK